jgi:serine/threonine protein kinase
MDTAETSATQPNPDGDAFSYKSGDRIGHYTIRQPLGEGGMGAVYHAQQTEPVKRDVALKVIKPGMDSRTVLARFEAERQALAMMDHPCVAKIFDGGMTEHGRPYFVMEPSRVCPSPIIATSTNSRSSIASNCLFGFAKPFSTRT